LENLKVGGCWHNIHFIIWALMHSMHGKQKNKKLDTSLLIADLHTFKPKLFVNYLLEFLL
jgi:hypothetical protein